jgi:hypothetical protein
VLDGERNVGRIFQQADGSWFWGVSFQLTGRKSYGHAATLDDPKAALRAEYPHAANNCARHLDTSQAVATRATFNWTKLRA